MQSLSRFRWRWPARRDARTLPYDVTETLLVVALVMAATALFWTMVRPVGPVGRWSAAGNGTPVADPSILTQFDPFFRSASAGTAAVTALPLKLYGVRLDQAMGRGSAIIATPDGVQNSFAVGDEIVPGVILKAVALDGVTIERGGTSEQLFLDQSVGAPSPAEGAPPRTTPGQAPAGQDGMTAPVTPTAPRSSALTLRGLADGVSFAPRIEKGAITGFMVGPKGAGDVFAATGLKQGDVVTQINGVEIRSLGDATSAIGNAARAGQATFTVDRGGKAVTVVAGGAR